MKNILIVLAVLMLAGCVAYPVYDDGYYYPGYGPYPYGYAGSDVTVFIGGFHGGHGFHDRGRGFHDGGHGFRGGGHWGGGRR